MTKSSESTQTSIVIHHNSRMTNITNLYEPDKTYDFTYSGDFENSECKIHDYNTFEIKQCFNDYHEILMYGDSRTRVLYRVLQGRYDGNVTVTDYKDHRNIIHPPFTFFWSVYFKNTVNSLLRILNDGESEKKRLVVIGEQLQWPQLDHLSSFSNCSQKTSRRNMQQHLDEAKTFIRQLDQFKNTKFLFVSAESRYDNKRREYPRCTHWTAAEWDSLSKFYTDSIRSMLKEYKPKNAMLMETNRITMEYAFDGGKTRQYLMPDGVHKMAHNVARNPDFIEKKIAPSHSDAQKGGMRQQIF